jgi:hypothetical protein
MHKHLTGPAKLDYRDGEYVVLVPGAYVVCAISGVQIPLEELRYWSVEHQEAYASPELVLKRYETALRKS